MTTYETTWLPAEWQDECIPEPLRHPTDFIHKCDDGSYILIPKKSKDDLEPDGDIEDQEHMLIKLSIGDIVHFQQTEQYGWFTLHVSEDRSFWIDGDYPSKANCFYESDGENIVDNLKDMVELCGEDSGPMSADTHEIQVYWWSDSIAYRFDVTPDGKPLFVEAGAVQ
ncbi:hypothetical protein LQT97_09690 [Brucella pseudogrignonensis]|uniref:hypothetical protein n=1 Tax=Brucella pseudogrignonensis TaxID=419475 RepID=UPI001E51A8A3|nr:hypothetical protein [Brucella pseudogrignonensis]MCD4511509.1 hypothetical protein [Brucella pseudogrignonensis]